MRPFPRRQALQRASSGLAITAMGVRDCRLPIHSLALALILTFSACRYPLNPLHPSFRPSFRPAPRALQQHTCGPIYVTIGDGGNVEGPYRNYVDGALRRRCPPARARCRRWVGSGAADGRPPLCFARTRRLSRTVPSCGQPSPTLHSPRVLALRPTLVGNAEQ